MKFPFLKEILSRAGVLVPRGAIHYLNGVLNYLHVGRWMHDHRFVVPVRVTGREALYRALLPSISEPATYLEFGVFDGTSMRRWAGLLRHPETTLDGFDSFEGLPENWGFTTPKEVFDVGGRIPQIDDARVRFHKGWFQETLPRHVAGLCPHPCLIIHLDADLYSSTIFVLRALREFLRPGTLLVFDEFFDREHELKAFDEFLRDSGLKVACVAATHALTQVAFRVV